MNKNALIIGNGRRRHADRHSSLGVSAYHETSPVSIPKTSLSDPMIHAHCESRISSTSVIGDADVALHFRPRQRL